MESKEHSPESILEIARHVLANDAGAVQNLTDALDENFLRAVEMIMETRGRVLLTGMGKSGYIAHKIASTLTSTGTLAGFLHPAEGFHGDLGIVSRDDLLLAISYSGETQEIIDLLEPLKRLGIPIIAITGNPDSQLARRADVHLHIGEIRESDPDNIVPTASALATLALGDALTVALMQLKDFRKEDYAVIHPRGMIGKRLTLKVQDLLKGEGTNPVITEQATFREALSTITHYMLGGVSIVKGSGKLAGIITDGDVRRLMERWEGTVQELMATPVSKIMTRQPTIIRSTELAYRALEMMENHQPRPIFLLPVVNAENRPVGMIHLHDLVQAGFKTTLNEIKH